MEVICLEDEAFFALLDRAVAHLKTSLDIKQDKWVSGEEAMKRLGITSKTTLQKYRDEGRIRFSQPDKKVILYDTESIDAFLNKHARDEFLGY